MSRDWLGHKERGTTFTIRLIRWIALNLGRPTARLLLYPITLYFILFAPGARHASHDYLRRVVGPNAGILHVTRHFHHFAATILDRVYFLTGREDKLDIRIHGSELVLDEIDAGNGCILLGAHVGSFEALRGLAVNRSALKLRIFMNEAHNQTITNLLNTLCPDIASTVIPAGGVDSLLQANEYIQDGYLIGILGDRVIHHDRVTTCRFLGSEAEFPTGPMLVAAALKRPVILFFGLYQGGGRYDIHFERFADCVMIDRECREQSLHTWTQHYADRVAHYTCQSPYNWFNFYEFWKDQA